MDAILNFDPQFVQLLPATHTLLQVANLRIHPAVSRIILHGSRGLAGGCRSDSDIDLSLIVDIPAHMSPTKLEHWVYLIFETTLTAWQPSIEPDLAIIFETRSCSLKCFEQTAWQENLCAIGSVDCFGLYKFQKGFTGLVTNAGVQDRLMYPCLQIWRRM